ncbi:MAG: ABC transporter substrate-binding protein [Acidimicrobiaceae bacterium]|jgi:ABC-type branched-subunit amino acid transport system substrate-binding protein
MKQLRLLLALLLAFSLVAAACGDDEDSSDSGSDSASTDSDSGSDSGSDDDTADAGDDTADAGGEMLTGAGVDAENKVIRVGLNADLSGTFAALTTVIVEGQEVFWERYNDQGGYKGWTVEPVVLDNAYDVPTHLENYDAFAGDGDDSVVMLTNSTGSPHTAAIAEALVEDDLVAIPLSWYSGWTDPAIGQNVLEVQANYCIEAMNGVTYMSETYGNKMAIASFPGDYGQDGAIGAKIAAEALGLEIVYDGEAAVIPGADQTPVVTGIAESGADFVWLTTGPGQTAEIVGGAAAAGFTGQWAGNSPAWNPALLATGLAEVFDASYTHSTYTTLWGIGDSPGMQDLVATMREYAPDNIADDVYIVSWIEGLIAQQVIENAIDNGDITRAGMVASANEITVDLQGLAPNQNWGVEANDAIVRGTYLYDVDLAAFTPDGTVSDDDANRGFTLLEGDYVSPTAAAWEYEPCFKAS